MPLRPVSELGLVEITDVPTRDDKRTATRSHSTRARRSPSQPLRGGPTKGHQPKARSDRSKGAGDSTRRKPDADRRASKRLAGTASPSAPEKGRRATGRKRPAPSQSRAASTPKPASTLAATAENAGGKSNRARSSTTTSSERSHSRAKPARDNGSRGATRSATTRTRKRSNGSPSAPRRETTVRRQTSAGAQTNGRDTSRETKRSRNGRGPEQTKPHSAAKIGAYVLMGASLVAGGLVLARAALHH